MFRGIFGKKRFEREMDEELGLHIDLQTQAYVEKGMDHREARRRAVLDFGSLESVREEARRTRALAWAEDAARDLRIAARGLLREPWFAFLSMLILALAIGANTTIFGILNVTFLRELPYPEPDRIVKLWEVRGDGSRTDVNYLDLEEWRRQQDAFTALAMEYSSGVTLVDGRNSARLQGGFVTRGYFSILGAVPQLGRDFTDADDEPGVAGVAILTADAWHRRFDGDPGVIGKSYAIDGIMVEIVGILPENFRHYRDVDLFIPLGPRAKSFFFTSRANRSGNTVLGHLVPGVTVEQARARIRAIAARIEEQYPENKGISADMAPMREALGKSSHERVLFLYGAVALFLVTACVNLSNMFLARGLLRGREMAIRAALGATRGQIVRQLLVESLLVSAIGGAVGVLLAWQLSAFASRLIPWEIRATLGDGSAFDWRVCLFAAVLTLAAGVLFGLFPALKLSHPRPGAALKEDSGTPGRRGRFSGSDLLTIVQVALVAVLLVTTALLLRSFRKVLETPSGIEARHLVSFQVSPPSNEEYFADPNAFGAFYLNLEEHLRQIPGVESASFCNSMAYTWSTCMMQIYRTDRPVPGPTELSFYYAHSAGTDIFRTLGIPLLKGRVFDGSESAFQYPGKMTGNVKEAESVLKNLVIDCVVSQLMAERFWPGEDPIGKMFHLGPPEINLGTARVIGIVGNTTQEGAERGEVAEFYIPFRSLPMPGLYHYVIRARGDSAGFMRLLEKDLAEYVPGHPVFDMHLMEERMGWFVADRRFTVQLLGFFALAALILAVAGIYGVISTLTARRTREIAIRLTLGATKREVLGGVLWRGALLVATGLAVGLLCAFLLQKFIQAQLFGVSGSDPVTFLAVAVLLAGVSLAACLAPAWRASRTDPMLVLRAD